MRYLQQILLALLVLTVPAYFQSAPEPAPAAPDDQLEIKKLLSEIEQAFVARDPWTN
jgi:hypothetical protein